MPIVKGNRAKAEASADGRDWAAFDAMTDEDIARQVAENLDAAPLLGEGEDLSKWKRVRGRPATKPSRSGSDSGRSGKS